MKFGYIWPFRPARFFYVELADLKLIVADFYTLFLDA